jgi:hypothetical protein
VGTDGLLGVACTTSTWCLGITAQVAPDYLSKATFFDGSAWSAPAPISASFQPYGYDCASSVTCVVVKPGNEASMYDGTAWSTPVTVAGAGTLTSVSCVTIRFCAAVDSDGQFVRATR